MSLYHEKRKTSPGRHTATLALEEAELDILKLMTSPSTAKKIPLVRNYINSMFKGTKAERFKKRLEELDRG